MTFLCLSSDARVRSYVTGQGFLSEFSYQAGFQASSIRFCPNSPRLLAFFLFEGLDMFPVSYKEKDSALPIRNQLAFVNTVQRNSR